MKSPAMMTALLLLTSALAQTPPDSVSLAEFQALAWPVSHRLAAARLDRAAAGESFGAAHALRGPSLSVELSGGWVSRTQELQMPGRTIQFGDGSSADAALLGTWMLYAGGALQAGEEAARAEARARAGELAADSLQLAEELRAAFFSALAAEAGLGAARLAVGRLERHLDDLGRRASAGAAGEEALLLAGGRLEAARQDLALRQGELGAACLDLGALCGRPGRPLAPAGGLETPLEGLDEPALRPSELAVLDARLEFARALVRQRLGGRKPKVDAQAGLHVARPGVDPVANDWMSYGAAGLRLRWSLWDGGLARRRVSEARLTEASLQRRRADAERRASSQLARTREQVDAARAAWESTVRRCDLEERRAVLVEERWQQGAALERDWLDAIDDLRLAEQERALGAARLRLAEGRRLQALGR